MSVRMLSRHPSPSPATASSSSVISSGSPTYAVAGSLASSSSAGSASGPGNGFGLPPAGNGGVVVVGAVGRVEGDVAQLLDRILDAQVFVGIAREGEGEEEKERRDEVRVQHESGREERQFYVSGRGRRAEGGTRLQETDTCDARRADSQSEEENATKLSGGERSYSQRRKDGLKSKSSQPERTERDAVEAKSGERGDVGKERETRKLGCLQSKLKHYYDEEKGVVYLQFTWGSLPLDSAKPENFRQGAGLEGDAGSLDHLESEGLRGLLFMFSVCHVILFVQEGAHFDPRHLRTFRLLQSAKHSLAPFVKSQVLPGLIPSGSGTRPSPLRPVSLASSNSSGRNGASGRHTSIIALMSGSAPILFPGQCTPVILFVFLEDSVDGAAPFGGRLEDAFESGVSSGQASQVSFISQLARHASQPKPVAPTMARPGSKSEVGFRKKMQTAVENQVRFLLKKCRTVATAGDPGPLGSGVGSGMGPRGPGSGVSNLPGGSGGGALFVLDPSRAVVLVDKSSNRTGDALDSVTEVIEEMLDGKVSSEDAIWELAGKSTVSGDEIQIIKDFLSRQAEILRGRGGISNSSAGGSAGVGMVAAAAAAAAASAAAGSAGGSGGGSKPLCAPPELPSMATWLAACRLIAEALSISEGRGSEHAARVSSPKTVDSSRSVLKKGSPGLILSGRGGVLGIVQNKGTVESAITCLEGGSDLDFKFSAAWCKRVLPSARDVYLKGLPSCYPTALHKAHLDKAIRAFRIMVRGPAVSIFVAKLQHECETVWRSGRQLCDAQSLTGKPCIHQVHEVSDVIMEGKAKGGTRLHELQERKEDSTKLVATGKENPIYKPHSSGVVFLHACACGRSRKLRKDPFNFESANVSFFQFPNCENMLPSFVLPDGEASKPLGGASWSLVRLGNAQYYAPATGLLQSGFCAKQNFFALWELSLVYRRLSAESVTHSQPGNKLPETFAAATRKTLSEGSKKRLEADNSELQVPGSNENKPSTKLSNSGKRSPEEPKMGFSRAVSSGSDIKRAPIEVNLNFFADPAFPPLPQRHERQPPVVTFKSGKGSGRDRKDAALNVPAVSRSLEGRSNNGTAPGDKKLLERPVRGEENLRILSTSFSSTAPRPAALATKTEHVRVYVGFEHECPYGHRYFLTIEHLNKLGPHFSQGTVQPNITQEPEGLSKSAGQDHKPAQLKSGRKYNVVHGHSPTEAVVSAHGVPDSIMEKAPESLGSPESFFIQESTGEGLVLLGANLPIFMNCPYCDVVSDRQEKTSDGSSFAGKVSQLQRIFLVTPPLPLLLASCPVVEFEESYGYARKDVKEGLKFSLGCELVLPPDSFLSLRLPFVYFTESEDGKRVPLLYKKEKPEQTAWLVRGSALFTLTKTGEMISGS